MRYDFQWIAEHAAEDVARLRLRYGAERADDILQIECRRRFGGKLRRTLAANPEFVFPTALAGEQSTSEALAAYHSSLLEDGERVADLTAGLGVDAMAMSLKANVVAVEMEQLKVDALQLNARHLPRLQAVCADCREWLAEQADGAFTTVFIDPARRAANGGRVYALSDCEPDVTAMLPQLRRVCKRLIIKASPMLDITHTLSLLPDAVRVIALGTTTECKELVIECHFDASVAEPAIEAVTLNADGAVVSQMQFIRSEEVSAEAECTVPSEGMWLYDPYPAVMKAAPMRLLGARNGVSKLAPQSHLWLSTDRVDAFPGHAYRVERVEPCSSRILKQLANQRVRASITTTNFPMTADVLRARLRAADGPARLFASTDSRGERVLIFTSPYTPTT